MLPKWRSLKLPQHSELFSRNLVQTTKEVFLEMATAEGCMSFLRYFQPTKLFSCNEGKASYWLTDLLDLCNCEHFLMASYKGKASKMKFVLLSRPTAGAL